MTNKNKKNKLINDTKFLDLEKYFENEDNSKVIEILGERRKMIESQKSKFDPAFIDLGSVDENDSRVNLLNKILLELDVVLKDLVIPESFPKIETGKNKVQKDTTDHFIFYFSFLFTKPENREEVLGCYAEIFKRNEKEVGRDQALRLLSWDIRIAIQSRIKDYSFNKLVKAAKALGIYEILNYLFG